jgi:lysozyme
MTSMTPDMKSKLRHLLIQHERYKQLPYTDSVGKITIGIGRNLTDRGVLPTEIDMMLDHDVDYFYNFLTTRFIWFQHLNENRQLALIDMCFMGTGHFMEFEKMIAALETGDYEKAADEILNSEYDKQVGQRAIDISNIIRSGAL